MSKSVNLSEYVAQDLSRRLLAGEVSEEELTLKLLGERYGVSVTPIRQAVDKLVEREFLVRRGNGRIGINAYGVRAATNLHRVPSPVTKPLDSHAWETLLSRDVIHMSLLGRSEFLREEPTASQYGIGRTALRQIFHRLSGQGLISHEPRRGWRVRPFETGDLDDFLTVREVLECRAMELAKSLVDRRDLQQMLEANLPEANGRLDNRLHDYFITRAKNRYIIDFFQRNSGYYTVILDWAAPETKRVAEMAAQHREILQWALDDRWDNAKSAMRHHILAQRPIVLEMITALRDSASSRTRSPSEAGTPNTPPRGSAPAKRYPRDSHPARDSQNQ